MLGEEVGTEAERQISIELEAVYTAIDYAKQEVDLQSSAEHAKHTFWKRFLYYLGVD